MVPSRECSFNHLRRAHMKLENPQEGFSPEDFLHLWAKYKLYPEPEMEALREVLGKYLPPLQPSVFGRTPVLLCEVGCCIGRLYPPLLELKGYEVSYVGVDVRKDYLRFFRAHHPNAEIYHFDVLDKCLSALLSEFRLSHFDVVYLPYTLIHLFPVNVQIELMSKLATALRPGGIMVIDILLKKETEEEQSEEQEFSGHATGSIPRKNKEPLEIAVHLGDEMLYEDSTQVTKLKVKGWVPYLFAGRSPQRYLVLEKP